jgi:FkbM family methyltransferase
VNMRSFIRSVAQRYGYDIVKYTLQSAESTRTTKLFHDHGISLVFDIGANAGQYAHELRTMGYRGRIVSCEPLTSAFAVIQEASKHDPLWTCVQTAVGNAPGAAMINVAGNSQSSSLLPMRSEHTEASPGSAYRATEQVKVTTVDHLFDQFVKSSDVVFVKIDTQGYERFVLEGARRSIGSIEGLELEMSFVPLYEGGWLFTDLLHFAENEGFVLTSLRPMFYHPVSGRVLQADGTFFRPPSTGTATS